MSEPTTDLTGTTFLVTGSNTGIGRATADVLAQRGGRVWVAARVPAKGQAAVAEIRAATGNQQIFYLPLDLADLDSVRAAAAAFLARDEPLHVLVNNAGIGGRCGQTRQGFELIFGTNHLGHFALTEALLGRLTESATPSAPSRVVTVASEAHYGVTGIDFEALRRPTPRKMTKGARLGEHEYAVSKLCNVLFTQELARRTAGTGVSAYSVHPGLVATGIFRLPWPLRQLLAKSMHMLPVAEGAVTSLYCATAPEQTLRSGQFYDKCAERMPGAAATPELAAALWEHSAAWTQKTPSGHH